MRQAVLACLLPFEYFAAERWWSGLKRISAQGRSISNRVVGHVSLIRKVILAGARAILPVYRTSPSSVLFREAGPLPPKIKQDKKARKTILHIHRLGTRHPLNKRVI